MAARKPRPSRAAADAAPLDVRLMNAVAALVFAAAAVSLLAAAVKWATRSSLFTVRAIVLDAAEPTPGRSQVGPFQRTNLASVRANALPRLAGNFFSVDLDASRLAFESVPWVRRAVVRRVWPNKLAVTLEEHQAAALWQGDERHSERLVNVQGEVFEANPGDVEDEDLPTLTGPDAQSAQMLAMLRRLSDALAPAQRRIDSLRLSSRGSWRAELDGGATLELGRGSDAEVVGRVERFVRTLGEVAGRFGGAPRALLAADLRHRDGYALRLAGISTATAASAATR
jgi:cell division protein FtsQ